MIAPKKTHCIRGHDLKDAYINNARGKPFRACRKCRDTFRSTTKPTAPDAKVIARIKDAWMDGVGWRDISSRFGLHHGVIRTLVKGLKRA